MSTAMHNRLARLEARHQAKPGSRRVFITFPETQTPEEAAKVAADVEQAKREGFETMVIRIVSA
jgi:hypothetical protein